VNCREFQEQITPAVDSRLDGNVLAVFLEHAALCAPCRHSYDGERHIADLVRSRLRPVAVPPELVTDILESIAREDATTPPARAAAFRWNGVGTKTAAAFALSFAAVVFLLTRNDAGFAPMPPPDTAGSDIIGQSVNAYRSALRGDVAPQIVSEVPDCVKSFFNGKTEFPVLVPAMKECILIGGGVSDFHGTMLAHVVYRHGGETISVYQACRETVMKGEKLHLPREALEELARTGWYCCTTPEGASIVVWTKGATLCAAVAPMNREHLMAHLVDAGDAGAW